MRYRIESLAVWLYARRRLFWFISNLLLTAGLWCLLVYTIGAEVIRGQVDEVGNLHDRVVINTAKLQDHKERLQRLEETQDRQDSIIGQTSQSIVVIQEKINTMTDSQSNITHLLYGVIIALITKIVLDLFRTNGNNHWNHDEPAESD